MSTGDLFARDRAAPDRWWIVKVSADRAAASELLPELLVQEGGRAVLEEAPGLFVTDFEPPDDPEARVESLRRALESEVGPVVIETAWQPHEAWAESWRRGIEVRRVSPRLVVRPSWLECHPQGDERVLVIDPGMAFGTAEHGTTRACLSLLDPAVAPGSRWADIGAGSGILSIGIALLGAAEVRAVEADPLAIPYLVENVGGNGVADRVRIEEARLQASDLARWEAMDGLVCNIETPLMRPLFPGFPEVVTEGGILVLSGVLTPERDAIVAEVSALGFGPEAETTDGEWWCGRFRRIG